MREASESVVIVGAVALAGAGQEQGRSAELGLSEKKRGNHIDDKTV